MRSRNRPTPMRRIFAAPDRARRRRPAVRLRQRLNLSQADLAQKIGSEQKSISRMENGRTFVSTRIMEKIAEATESELRVEFLPRATKTSCPRL